MHGLAFQPKPALKVNHDAHDVAEAYSVQSESPLRWNCNCQTQYAAWQNARWIVDGHGQFQIRGSPLLFSFSPGIFKNGF